MEKFDLRELNRMVKRFRGCHRAAKVLREDDRELEVTMTGRWGSTRIAISSQERLREHLLGDIERELADLRKKFNALGIDPLDIDGRKKKKPALKTAK